MGLLPRTTIRCFLWCYTTISYLSLAEGERKEPIFCYANIGFVDDSGLILKALRPAALCYASVLFTILNGTIALTRFFYNSGAWRQSSESENPLGCELWDNNEDKIWYPKDEKEFSQYDNSVEAVCFCNQSAICATQPETFESILNTQRSNSPFYAIKAAEIVLKYMRAGEMPNNALEAFKEFEATSSTPISTTEATTTVVSTVETTTTTETSSTDTSATSTETSTTATSTTSTETSSTTFATASDYEYSDTSTTSAYDDSTTFVTDTAAEVSVDVKRISQKTAWLASSTK